MKANRVLLPVRTCAWEACAVPFRPGRDGQDCCSALCERRRNRALHPSAQQSRTAAPAKRCKASGCDRRVRTEAAFCSEHTGSRHGRAPSVLRAVETSAAKATACPRCGGPIVRAGHLVSCLDRSETNTDACGWVELARRHVRAPSVGVARP